MSVVYYKVLGDQQNSHHGGQGKWVKGRWRTVQGDIVPCRNGLHYCRDNQLLGWLGPTIWLFEDGSPDETIDAGDKMVTRRGRIVERVETWNERTARLFAADCAEAVLPIFEKKRPGDDRPRLAIEAARAFANGQIGEKELAAASAAARDAAWAASAGDAASAAAWDAAWAAARDAAWDAARDAAWAAAGAAWAAAGAARDAARAAGDAARADQTALLIDYLEGRRT